MIKSKEFFEEIVSQILVYEKPEAKEIAFWLLEHFLKLSKIDILTNKNLPENNINWQEIIERLNKNEPIQYILGETMFFGRKFLVNLDVLIPRPETEELVSLVKKSIKNFESNIKYQTSNINILDIGTGSGCIAISLAKELPNSQVFAYDISEKALKIAKKNAELNEAKVVFEKKDILKNSLSIVHCPFYIIVSNPPYITKKEKKIMQKNVLDFEPHLALFVEDNEPLIFYDTIAKFARNNLIINGLAIVEINENLGKETAKVFIENGFSEVEIIKDFHGKERFVKAALIE